MAGASQGLHDHLDLWAGAKEGWDGQGGETGKRVRTHLNPMRVALWRGLVYERGHNPAHKVWGVLILREQIARFPCSVHTDKGAVGMERARSICRTASLAPGSPLPATPTGLCPSASGSNSLATRTDVIHISIQREGAVLHTVALLPPISEPIEELHIVCQVLLYYLP